MAFNFGEQFNRGLQFGTHALQRKTQIEEDYRRAQQAEAQARALQALRERGADLAETQEARLADQFAFDKQRTEDEKIDVVTGVTTGPTGLPTPVSENMSPRKFQSFAKLSEMTRAQQQLEAMKGASVKLSEEAGLGLSPEEAAAIPPDELLKIINSNRTRQNQLDVARAYRSGTGGGGRTPTRTADERMMGEVLAIPPARRMAFINEEIGLIESIFPEDRSTSESERLFRLKVARERLNASGAGAGQAAPSPSNGNFGLMGTQGEALQRVLSQGARQGAPSRVSAPGGNGVPTVETREQFDALEEGAVFLKGGAQYRKRGNQLVRIN